MVREREPIPRWLVFVVFVVLLGVLAGGFVVSRQSVDSAATGDAAIAQLQLTREQVLAFAQQVGEACSDGTVPATNPLCTRAAEVRAAPVPAVPGVDGKDGINGRDGRDGRDGITPPCLSEPAQCRGTDGRNGVDGKDGKDGQNGKDGADGREGPAGPSGPPGCDFGTHRDPASGACVRNASWFE